MSDSYNLAIYQGSTLALTLTLNDSAGNAINLSNYVVSGQIRNRYSSTGVLAQLTATITSAVNGQISVSLPATTTRDLPVGIGVYDIEITNTGTNYVTKPLVGKAYVYPEVTM
jgi:hypothetical protein